MYGRSNLPPHVFTRMLGWSTLRGARLKTKKTEKAKDKCTLAITDVTENLKLDMSL